MTESDKDTCCGSSCSIEMDLETPELEKMEAGEQRQVFRIENMDCPTEQGMIEKKLLPLAGISKLSFNLMDRKLTVDYKNIDGDSIESALKSIGMDAVAIDEQQQGVNTSSSESVSVISTRERWLTVIALTFAIVAEGFAWVSGNEKSWIVITLSLLAITISGIKTYHKGWIALSNLNLNINALMSIAVTGAVIIGQWPEAAMVMVLFSIAEMIEALSLERARNAIRSLMALTPEKATVKQSDGKWLEIDTRSVKVDMLVRIKPGERIPLDGEIVKGQSSVDQSPITGESIPVEKTPGDKVFAGTINQTGSFDFKVTALASQSTLARIIKAVEQAQSKRAPTQRFVDKFAKVYTPAVFILALLVSVLPPLLWGEPWGDWFYKSLVLLVIACPCALVISTPVTVVSGLAAAARRGILVKGGVYLENGHTIEMLALDKTGTITSGKPEVTDVIDLDNDPKNSNLNIIYSLANRSDHPVSMAISNYIKSQPKLDLGLQEVDDFSALTGRGIKGKVKKQLYYLGNHRLLKELGLSNPELEKKLNTLEQEGKTVVILATEEKPLLLVAVADTVKESSRQAIAELLNMGIRTLMLTGDNNKTAEAIASNVGLKEFRGELLPEDKLNFISEALTQHKSVAMVGDGINDAPALARASIGFAMGAAGTDTAIETADVALMDDDLGKIAQFIKLSRKTSSLLKQNITIALGIKVVFMVLAFMGIATLWMAVFADMGASLIVVANGLRLLKFKG